MYTLIGKLIRNASKNKSNAHAFANHCVIRDLSKAIFGKQYVDLKADWMCCEPHLIREKSLALYMVHTERLNEIGRTTVSQLIE